MSLSKGDSMNREPALQKNDPIYIPNTTDEEAVWKLGLFYAEGVS